VRTGGDFPIHAPMTVFGRPVSPHSFIAVSARTSPLSVCGFASVTGSCAVFFPWFALVVSLVWAEDLCDFPRLPSQFHASVFLGFPRLFWRTPVAVFSSAPSCSILFRVWRSPVLPGGSLPAVRVFLSGPTRFFAAPGFSWR